MTVLSSRPVTFLLNGVETTVSPERADVTLLNWLRQDRGLTGSKEGCAEGDCGACSVVVARLNDAQVDHTKGRISHHAANACILFLPMIDGLSITTVEGIAGPKGEWHPVQEAMVKHHGSQCGFCTPGFVLSLFAGWRQGMTWQRPQIEELLAGNLCRCTGYGPIVTAAESLAHADHPEWDQQRFENEKHWLVNHRASDLDTGQTQRFMAPKTIKDLSHAIADHPQFQILAGATDIGLWVTKQHRKMPGFISVMAVDDLAVITDNDDHYTIPAAVSHNTAHQALAQDFPPLDALWKRFGSAQVRASGTVCGNLANGSPIGDLAPCFLALGAELTLQYRDQERPLPLHQFFLGYQRQDRRDGEWLKAVKIPKLAADEAFYALKISRRFDQDISAVMGAFWFQIKDGQIMDARLGYGGMAAIPARAPATEQALIGRKIDEVLKDNDLGAITPPLKDALAQDFTPIDDVRASRDYRQHMAFNLLMKALRAAASGTPNAAMLAGFSDQTTALFDAMADGHVGAAE